MANETVWVLVADGGGARFFHRDRPGFPLVEVQELAESSDQSGHHTQGAHRVHEHTAHGAHAGGSRMSPHEEAEQHFLKHVAAQLDRAVSIHGIERLVICAPPHALGLLRDSVSSATRKRVVRELAKDILRERVSEIDERLKEQGV